MNRDGSGAAPSLGSVRSGTPPALRICDPRERIGGLAALGQSPPGLRCCRSVDTKGATWMDCTRWSGCQEVVDQQLEQVHRGVAGGASSNHLRVALGRWAARYSPWPAGTLRSARPCQTHTSPATSSSRNPSRSPWPPCRRSSHGRPGGRPRGSSLAGEDGGRVVAPDSRGSGRPTCDGLSYHLKAGLRSAAIKGVTVVRDAKAKRYQRRVIEDANWVSRVLVLGIIFAALFVAAKLLGSNGFQWFDIKIPTASAPLFFLAFSVLHAYTAYLLNESTHGLWTYGTPEQSRETFNEVVDTGGPFVRHLIPRVEEIGNLGPIRIIKMEPRDPSGWVAYVSGLLLLPAITPFAWRWSTLWLFLFAVVLLIVNWLIGSRWIVLLSTLHDSKEATWHTKRSRRGWFLSDSD